MHLELLVPVSATQSARVPLNISVLSPTTIRVTTVDADIGTLNFAHDYAHEAPLMLILEDVTLAISKSEHWKRYWTRYNLAKAVGL